MASLTPQQRQQRVPLNNATILQQQQQQAQQPQSQHQVQVLVQPRPQSQLQYAPQLAPAPVAALQQPQLVRSPTLGRKPVGQKAVIPSNTAPGPITRPGSVASAPLASQQPPHVQAVGPSGLQQQQYQRIQTTPNAQPQPIQQLQAPVNRPVVQRPAQIQQQPSQQPQIAQQRPQQTQTAQYPQSAGAFLNSQHVQQITGGTPPLPRRTAVPTLQPQQQQQPQQQPQQQQPGNRFPVQRTTSYASTTSTGAHSASPGPSVMTPSTGPTTPGTPNLTSSPWKQTQPPSNAGRPIQQQPGTSTIFCNHCKTGVPSTVSTYTCLICSTANILTYFCVWCFTSGAAATSHPHGKAYYANESDLRMQLAPNSGVPTHLWTVRRNVAGTLWYTHNASGYNTHIKPHTAVVGSQGLAPGWDERRTPDGKTFFFNSATRATSWVRPLNSLPPGWKELRTPDLVPFYVHEGMALASWERPGQQPKGRRSNMTGRPGASNAGDSLKKMWGKLGKTKNLNKMTRIATTVNNLADGNVEPEEGDAEGDFGEASVGEETVDEYPGDEFGGEVQQDVQTEVYTDDAAFQQVNSAGEQEQPLYNDPSEAVQQPMYEQPMYAQTAYAQPTYEQPVCEQSNISYQQPTYGTDQHTLVMEQLAQPPLTNDTAYAIQQPQPDPNQLFMAQEPFGMTPEQETLVQSQRPYTSPVPGILENQYQTTTQQEPMLNQPISSLAQPQPSPMHQIIESPAPTQQPALTYPPIEQSQMPAYTQPAPGVLETPYQTPIQQELVVNEPTTLQVQRQEAPIQQMTQPTLPPALQPASPFSPQEQVPMSVTPGHIPQEQQQIIVNNEVTVIEVESNVTNNTAQVIDPQGFVVNAQSNTTNGTQSATQTNIVEQNFMVDGNVDNNANSENFVNRPTDLSVNGIGSESSQVPPIMPPVDNTPGDDSAGPLPGPGVMELAQIPGETDPAICDISSLSGAIQSISISAQDAVSPPAPSEPVLAAEPTVSLPAEQYRVDLAAII